MVEKDADKQNTKSKALLRDFLQNCQVYEIKLTSGSPACESKPFNVYFMDVGVNGSFLFWPIIVFYQLLGLSAYKGSAGAWADRVWARGNAWLRTIMKVVPFFKSHASKDAASDKTKFSTVHGEVVQLPDSSWGTIAILAMLARWCGLPQNAGGLRTPQDRFNAKQLLGTFCWFACAGAAFDLSITTRGQWQNCWPAPEAQGTRVTVFVSRQGVFDPRRLLAMGPEYVHNDVAETLVGAMQQDEWCRAVELVDLMMSALRQQHMSFFTSSSGEQRL